MRTLSLFSLILTASWTGVSGSMLLGSKCTSDGECQQHVAVNSRCFEERCACLPYYAAYNQTTCLESTLLGFDCQVDEQCSLKTAHSVCIEGSCGCDVGFLQFRRHTCLKPAKPGEVCYSNAHCLLWDTDSHCEFMIRNLLGRCMCNTVQNQRGNVCSTGSSSDNNNNRPMVEEPAEAAEKETAVKSESIKPLPNKKPPPVVVMLAKPTSKPAAASPVLPEITVSSHVITHVYTSTTAKSRPTISEYYTTSTKPFYDNSLPEAPPVPGSSEPIEEPEDNPLPIDDLFMPQFHPDTPADEASTSSPTTEVVNSSEMAANETDVVTSPQPVYIQDTTATTQESPTEDDMTSSSTEDDTTSSSTEDDMTSSSTEDNMTSSSTEGDVTLSSTEGDVTSSTTEGDVTSSDDLVVSQSQQGYVVVTSHTTTATRTRLEDTVSVSLGLRCVTNEQCQRADPDSRCVDGVCDCAARGNGSDACSAANRGTHPFTFQCRSSGLTISWFFVCDGRQDCADGSDEECKEGTECPASSYQCGDGSCVSLSTVCDGAVDCSTGRDEMGCTTDRDQRCPPHTFRCGDGACLPEYEFCNAVVTCRDGSDEPHDSCKTRSRRRTQYCPFRCGNGRCRSTAIVCSGKDGCGDGSDEVGCSVCKCPAVH